MATSHYSISWKCINIRNKASVSITAHNLGLTKNPSRSCLWNSRAWDTYQLILSKIDYSGHQILLPKVENAYSNEVTMASEFLYNLMGSQVPHIHQSIFSSWEQGPFVIWKSHWEYLIKMSFMLSVVFFASE